MGKVTGKVKVNEVKAQEVKAEKATKHQVKVMGFLKHLNLDWVLERPLEEGDLDILGAKVTAAEDGTEWASWWMPYTRVDGSPVKGISWGVSAPLKGGFLMLRLWDSGVAKATIRAYPSGKGVITGSPEIVKALTARPDLPPWTDQDTASLL